MRTIFTNEQRSSLIEGSGSAGLGESQETVKIKVYPFKHPHTGWKDSSRIALKVPKESMSTTEFAAQLKQMHIPLHPEFPKVSTGGVYRIAIVSKADWKGHEGQKVTAKPKAAPLPEVPDPPKLTKEEIKFLKMLKAHEDMDQYGQWGPGAKAYHGKKLLDTEHAIATKLHGTKFVHQVMTIYDNLNKSTHRLVDLKGKSYQKGYDLHSPMGQDDISPKSLKKGSHVNAHAAPFIDEFLHAHHKAYGY